MAYRDDHDAALARASALADELKRTEAERDQLREQVAKLAQIEPAHVEPPAVLAPVKPAAMAPREVDELVAALEAGRQQIRVLKTARLVGAGLLIAVAIATFFMSVLAGLLTLALGIVALVKSLLVEDGDYELILEAVRAHPEEIVEIRDRVTTKGNRWVTLSSRDGATARFLPVGSAALVVALARRCPAATLR